jgi:shikimate O-hydroxycinnamoyltransferase
MSRLTNEDNESNESKESKEKRTEWTQRSVVYVKPSMTNSLVGEEIVKLSLIDNMLNARGPITYMFYYHAAAASMYPLQLQNQLAYLLNEYRILAGRFLQPDEYGAGAVVLNDAGARFIVGTIDASLDGMLEDIKKSPLNQPASLASTLDKNKQLTEPLLQIKATYFKCRAVCISVAIWHNIVDGSAYSNFMSHWSQICTKGITLSRLIPRIEHGCSASLHSAAMTDTELDASSDVSYCKSYRVYDLSKPSSPVNYGNPILPFPLPECQVNNFLFTNEQLAKLKQKACPADGYISTADALIAHVWRCVILARNSTEGIDDDLIIKHGFAINGRSRLDPPLPAGYTGNVNFFGVATTTVKELLDNDLSYAAGLLRKAVLEMNNEELQHQLKFIRNAVYNEKNGFSSIKYQFWGAFGKDIVSSNMSKYDLYKIDFGAGNPIHVTIAPVAFDGLFRILPTVRNNGVMICIGLRTEHMIEFEKHIYNT